MSVLVRDGERVNRSDLLTDERAVIRVRPLRSRGGRDGDAQRPALPARDVVDVEAPSVLRKLRSPEAARGPIGPTLEDGADDLPVDEVARVEYRKLRPPLGRCGRGPV